METAVEGGAEEHEKDSEEEDDEEGGSRGVGRAVPFYALATIASAAKSAGNRGRAMPPSPDFSNRINVILSAFFILFY